MTGGLSQGFEDAGAARRTAVLVRLTMTLGFIAVIVLLYRFSGVDRSALAGQSAVALAALIPLATTYRRALLLLRGAPSPDSHASGMATHPSAS
jgi:hypothetical protein